MSRLIRKKKEHIGLSPYAIVFRGQQKTDKTHIRVMDFDIEEVREYDIESIGKLSDFNTKNAISWLNIDGLHDSNYLSAIAKTFEIPDNILSDILNPSLRPKVQEFEQGVFITLKMLQYDEVINHLSVENLCLVVMNQSILSFQEEPGDVFNPVRDRIRKHKTKIRTSGTDYIAFALLDIVVDNYIYILGMLGDKVDELEEQMTKNPTSELLDEINLYKCELNLLRKNIKPAKEMIMNLVKIESEYLQNENYIHYRELLDNINEANDLSDSYREILYDQLNIYHTFVSSKLNEIIRILTIFSVIFIPLTFIAGIYGTNFDYLPELHWEKGYFMMWGVMVAIAMGMLAYFKWKKWF